jgi:hypothetical protein
MSPRNRFRLSALLMSNREATCHPRSVTLTLVNEVVTKTSPVYLISKTRGKMCRSILKNISVCRKKSESVVRVRMIARPLGAGVFVRRAGVSVRGA